MNDGRLPSRSNRYFVDVDPSATNTAHAHALAMVGHNKCVLELGSGPGHITRRLVEQGCRVTAIDADAAAASEAGVWADEVVVGDLEDLETLEKLPDGKFDVILAGDVLEHLREPVHVLRMCRRLVRRGGSVVASLPNIAHADVRLGLLRGRFDYQEWGLLDRTHLRLFTRSTAEEILRSSGFTPIELLRTIVPVFHTELGIDRESFSEEIVREALDDPEAETYQFVFRAVVDDGDAAVRSLADRCLELEDELRREHAERVVLEARLQRLDDQRADAEHRAEAGEREIRALYETKTLRYAASLRRLYGRLRNPS